MNTRGGREFNYPVNKPLLWEWMVIYRSIVLASNWPFYVLSGLGYSLPDGGWLCCSWWGGLSPASRGRGGVLSEDSQQGFYQLNKFRRKYIRNLVCCSSIIAYSTSFIMEQYPLVLVILMCLYICEQMS